MGEVSQVTTYQIDSDDLAKLLVRFHDYMDKHDDQDEIEKVALRWLSHQKKIGRIEQ